MSSVIRLLLVLYCYTASSTAMAVDPPYYYSSKKEIITVLGESEGYISEIYCKGFFQNNKTSQIYIPYTELEKISNINISYQNEKGKNVRIRSKDIGNTMVPTGSFYSGLRSYFFNLDPQSGKYPFEYSYTESSDMLMLLSMLPMQPMQRTDTLIYEIKVPHSLKMHYKITGDTAALKYLKQEGINTDDHKIYTFLVLPGEVKKRKPRSRRYVYALDDFPRIEIVITPAGVPHGFAYLNRWYNKLVEPNTVLQPATIAVIDSVTRAAATDEEKVERLFDFVKEKVAYLDVENGLGAFQPRDPNSVLLKQQGDCKDMSNLLYCSLKHLGYDAHLALSSSLSHFTDLYFPNLSSANHVICVVKLDDEWIYLDATDAEIRYGYPSRHTQDRNIFIVNGDEGELHKIAHVPAYKNKIWHGLHLKKSGNSLSGSASYSYHGLSMIEILTFTNRQTSSTYLSNITKELKSMSKNLAYENISLNDHEDSLSILSDVSSEKNFLTVAGKNYLSLNFLPRPHNLPLIVDNDEKIISYKAVHNEFEVLIDLGGPGKLANYLSAEYDKEGMRFSFRVEQLGPEKIKLAYNCEIDHVVIEKERLAIYHEMNKIIENIFNQSIIYE